ncbi:flavodoxin domain-containing protein [Bacteroidota bacterium]
MKSIVVYYSRKGSNKYLAEKIASELSCDIEALRPRLNVFMFYLMNIHMGIRPLRNKVEEYDHVIMCGPIWMGKFIPPLRSFVRKYSSKIKKLIFVTCCGSTYDKKDEKFGHGLVFKEVEGILDGKCILCQAFPIGLVMPEDQKEDTDAFMKTHLNDENFKGEIQEIYDKFIGTVKETIG